MRLAVISDIHSNLEALSATLEVLDDRKVDEIYCLGDIVGYGANPSECVDLVRGRCEGVVLGNHDEAVARLEGLHALPPYGRTAAIHNRKCLGGEEHDGRMLHRPHSRAGNRGGPPGCVERAPRTSLSHQYLCGRSECPAKGEL